MSNEESNHPSNKEEMETKRITGVNELRAQEKTASEKKESQPVSRKRRRELREQELKADKEAAAKQERRKELALEEEEITSRKGAKRQKKQLKKQARVRIFPIWLRLIVIVILCFVGLSAGAMIGYGVIGKGGSPFDVFHKDVWLHIYNLVYQKK